MGMVARLHIAAAVLCLTSQVAAEEQKPAELNRLRLYVPIRELDERFGKDIEPVTEYIKALEKRTGEILSEGKQPKVKGLLLAVGIKSKKQTRIWCEPVEGKLPSELIERLEKELAKVEAVDLKKAPAAFALEINLFGHKPDAFPEFPQIWKDAAEKSETKLLVPPDDLFKVIWPDEE